MRPNWNEGILIAFRLTMGLVLGIVFSSQSSAESSATFLERTLDDPINLFTGVLAVFTVVLAGASIWQGRLTRQSIVLARDEFNASHRPKIRVRHFRNVSKKAGEDFEIHFVCANVGDLPCSILEISYQTHTRKILTAKDEIDRPALVPNTFKNIVLHPGTELAAGELCEFQTELFKLEWNMNKNWDFAGYVRYQDNRQIERFTGFWQRFDRLGFPVATPENPNFIYED